jgi:hypothetical protein
LDYRGAARKKLLLLYWAIRENIPSDNFWEIVPDFYQTHEYLRELDIETTEVPQAFKLSQPARIRQFLILLHDINEPLFQEVIAGMEQRYQPVRFEEMTPNS